MIKILDLIRLGQWLDENKLDTFGKQIKDDDNILLIGYDNQFFLKNILKKSDLKLNELIYHKSFYINDCFISTDQRIMIPSKSNLMGLTPFCLKIDHDFLKKGVIDQVKIDKFKNKVNRSFDANKNSKEFVNEIDHLYNNEELLNSPLSEETKNNLIDFFSRYSLEQLKQIILDYYQFLVDNIDDIITTINEYKKSDNYDNKKSNFYLLCTFNNEFDLLNDIFYYYSKFIKVKNKFSGDASIETCVNCGEKGITVPSSGSFVSEKYYYFNNNVQINNSHLKLCKKCNSYMSLAEDKLKKSLISNIYIIPKSRENNTDNFDNFLKILNNEENDFAKLNELLYHENIYDYFDLDLAIYTQEQGDSFPLRKYVENYRSYLIKFDDIKLVENGSYLNYLFDEYIKITEKREKFLKVKNIFDIERIFKNFFTYADVDGKTQSLILKYLYQIYSKDFGGKTGITNNLDSITTSLFSKYMQNMFSFIYELNFDAINKQALDEIVLNCIKHYVKINNGESYGKYNYTIKERLNEYYMLMNEFWGRCMFDKEKIKQLKEEFINYKKDDDFMEFKQKVIPLIESSSYNKYYLIGQFIKYIDNFKLANGFNPEIFNNFMTNINRNNIKKMFTTEILQKNIYYINQMTKKSKLIFEVLEENLETLFDEEDMTYEDYILTMCTGYYTENILSNKKEEGKTEGE